MEDQLMDSQGAPIPDDNDTLFDAPPMAEQERMVAQALARKNREARRAQIKLKQQPVTGHELITNRPPTRFH